QPLDQLGRPGHGQANHRRLRALAAVAGGDVVGRGGHAVDPGAPAPLAGGFQGTSLTNVHGPVHARALEPGLLHGAPARDAGRVVWLAPPDTALMGLNLTHACTNTS